MNWLGITYLILSGISLLFALAYAAQSLALRTDPVQPAIALVSLGFGMFDAAVAFTSLATGAPPEPSSGWYLAGGAGETLIYTFLPVTAWTLLEQPLNRVRVAIACGLGLFGMLRTIDLGLHATAAHGIAWDGMNGSAMAMVAGTSGMFVGMIWTFESAMALQRGSRYAGAMLVFGAVGLVATAHGALVTYGVLSPPAYYGFAALPFVGFVHVVTSLRFVHAIRTAQAPAGDMHRYQVLEKLGAGGMGDVFLARRKGPAGFLRDVVLKTLNRNQGDPKANERFLTEARLAAQLRHPNIVDVYDLGEQPNGFFIVMERIDGATLSEAMQRAMHSGAAMPCEVVAELGAQICRALGYAHAARVIHRDIKPANVMVTFTGVAKLIDFGIAQSAGLQDSAESVAGTPGYMAPERWAGGDGTVSTDLFALGVTLYQLLTFRSPFSSIDEKSFASAVARGTFVRLDASRPDCPPALAAAIHQCLEADPLGRPMSAATLNAMLEKALVDKRVDLGAWMTALFALQVPMATPDGAPTTPHPQADAPTVTSR